MTIIAKIYMYKLQGHASILSNNKCLYLQASCTSCKLSGAALAMMQRSDISCCKGGMNGYFEATRTGQRLERQHAPLNHLYTIASHLTLCSIS